MTYKRSLSAFLLLIGVATLPRVAFAAADCSVAVQAAKAEWHQLSHGELVAPSQTIGTADGRRLAGSLINYSRILIDRADQECEAAQSAQSIGDTQQAWALLRPSPGQYVSR